MSSVSPDYLNPILFAARLRVAHQPEEHGGDDQPADGGGHEGGLETEPVGDQAAEQGRQDGEGRRQRVRQADVGRAGRLVPKLDRDRHADRPVGHIGQSRQDEDRVEPGDGLGAPGEQRAERGGERAGDEHGPVAEAVAQPAHRDVGDRLADGQGGGQEPGGDLVHLEALQPVEDVEGEAHRGEVGEQAHGQEGAEVAVAAQDLQPALPGRGPPLRDDLLGVLRFAGQAEEDHREAHRRGGQQEAQAVVEGRIEPVQEVAGADRGAAEQDVGHRRLQAEEGAAPVRGDDLGDQRLPGVGGEAGTEALPDEQGEGQPQGGLDAQPGQEESHQRQPEIGQALVDGDQHDHRLVAPQAGDRVGHEQLRQLPTDGVDGGDQADQQGRIGHLGDEERDDRAEGAETPAEAEEAPVEQVDGQVVFQVLADGSFERRHTRRFYHCQTPGVAAEIDCKILAHRMSFGVK